MAVFRVNKNKDYTTISNFHLKDKNLSLKAKGLLSMMLSLPEDWDYSVKGLTAICLESKNTINSILNELEKNNYLVRKRIYIDGKISEWEYNIYENNDLHPKNEDLENEDLENWDVYKYTNKLNTKEYKENIIINNNIKEKNKKPTLEEIEKYISEKKLEVNAKQFYDYFEVGGWKDSKGNKVKNWKQKLLTWNKFNSKKDNNKKKWWEEDE